MGNTSQIVQYFALLAILLLALLFMLALLSRARGWNLGEKLVWGGLARLFPGTMRGATLRHLEKLIEAGSPARVVDFARRFQLERQAVAAAGRLRGTVGAARIAARLGLDAESERLFLTAFQETLSRGAEIEAVSLAEEGKVFVQAARELEKAGGPVHLANAAILYDKGGELLDAGRCYEAAGEPFTAFEALRRHGKAEPVEMLLRRTRDYMTRQAAEAWLRARFG